jgi:hypothetical protein
MKALTEAGSLGGSKLNLKGTGWKKDGTSLSAFRPRGVPGPTSEMSLRVPAQMDWHRMEHKMWDKPCIILH